MTGRPYPLKGRYYANIFVHFEPSGHCMRHSDRMRGYDVKIDDAKTLYEQAKQKAVVKDKKVKEEAKYMKGRKDEKHRKRYEYNFEEGVLKPVLKKKNDEDEIEEGNSPSTPYYIPAGSVEEKRWRQKINYHVNKVRKKSFVWTDILSVSFYARYVSSMFIHENSMQLTLCFLAHT